MLSVNSDAALFVFGILPYWYSLWLPEKTLHYWGVLAWCCVVWIVYFAAKQQWPVLLNSSVELLLALHGLYYVTRRKHG